MQCNVYGDPKKLLSGPFLPDDHMSSKGQINITFPNSLQGADLADR